MEYVVLVCTIISALWTVKPWRAWPWFKRLYWRLRHRAEYMGEYPELDDPLERFRQSGASAALFKTDRLYY